MRSGKTAPLYYGDDVLDEQKYSKTSHCDFYKGGIEHLADF